MATRYKYTGILGKKREPIDYDINNKGDLQVYQILHDLQTKALVDELLEDCSARPRPMYSGLGAARAPSRPWEYIAMTLAERHVPGFQVRTGRKRGRPKKDDRAIYLAMRPHLEKRRRVSAAAKSVSDELKKKGQSNATKSSVESAYYRFVRHYPELKVQRKSK